jgi:hypothetical protein
MKSARTRSANTVEVLIRSGYVGICGLKRSAINARGHGWNVLPGFDLKSQPDVARFLQRQVIYPGYSR